MFKAYFDEGGITKLDRAAAFAGFMGGETRCDEMALKWLEIIKPIGEFHATDFFARGASGCMLGRYSNLSPDTADAIVIKLIDLLYESKLEPIGMAIDAEVFRSLSVDERRWMTSAVICDKTWPSQGTPKYPQFACFHYCLTETNKFTLVEEKMFITCARTTIFERTMSKIYADFLVLDDSAEKRGGRLAETIAFSSPKECPLLQAADLLAYVIGKNVTQNKIGNSVVKHALDKLALRKDYVRAMDQESIDLLLRRHPFRTTFWNGMTEPDYLEDLRTQGIEVIASKVKEGVYRTHHIKAKDIQILGEAGENGLVALNRTQFLTEDTKKTEVPTQNETDSEQDSQIISKDQTDGK